MERETIVKYVLSASDEENEALGRFIAAMRLASCEAVRKRRRDEETIAGDDVLYPTDSVVCRRK